MYKMVFTSTLTPLLRCFILCFDLSVKL